MWEFMISGVEWSAGAYKAQEIGVEMKEETVGVISPVDQRDICISTFIVILYNS
jgi:hypothetical protein